MTKKEYIEKYGEDWYNSYIERCKKYRASHKEEHSLATKIWNEENKLYLKTHNKERFENNRKMGITPYCKEDYDLIENYEQAKADEFVGWHLHHRLENYWGYDKLIKKKIYLNINPEALIWLLEKEHNSDCSLASTHPEQTKWHQRKLEND